LFQNSTGPLGISIERKPSVTVSFVQRPVSVSDELL